MKKDKPLPTPPNTPYGRKRAPIQGEDQSGLMADHMAKAMAEGKLEEFMKQEMPDNEYAKNLVNMMLGMTGMLPMAGQNTSPSSPEVDQQSLSAEPRVEETSPPEMPEDVRMAIEGGDVNSLKNILRREYLKRTPGVEFGTSEEPASPQSQAAGMPTIDKELIDALVQIARDNSVTMDWMILRAIKLYVQEYRKTGRL
jgi:hypothetical protein